MAKKKRSADGLKEAIKTVVYAVLIALAIRTFAYEPFNIPSGSMMPTLLQGDYLFVSKFSYGYSRYTIAFGLPLFDGRILGGEPERGDVVVFMLPADPSQNYIKRVVGLPGDRVQVVDGVLHINGDAVERELVDEMSTRTGAGLRQFGAIYVETLPNGHRHYIREISDSANWDNTEVYEVPDGHYFMMGDNRDSSEDSRAIDDDGTRPVGFVPLENLVGRAEVLWFSIEGGSFWDVWRWPSDIRWNRLFTAIE